MIAYARESVSRTYNALSYAVRRGNRLSLEGHSFQFRVVWDLL